MKRTRTLSTKCTEDEEDIFRARAAAVDMNVSEYMHSIAFADPINLRHLNLHIQIEFLRLRGQLNEQTLSALVADVDIAPKKRSAP